MGNSFYIFNTAHSSYGPDHPYGRMSSVEDIKAVTQQDLLDFFRHFYLNAKCIIFAAGKLPADFQQQLDQHFGDLNLNENLSVITHRQGK